MTVSDNQVDAEVTETETEDTTEQQPKPTETVEFWKEIAQKQEKRAKENSAAAKKLAELEEAQKSDAEKATDRITKAETEAASVPAKVAEALKTHLVELHGIDSEDAELFLTAGEPDLLIKQVTRLLFQSDTKRRSKNNSVPREGNNPTAATGDLREFTQGLFGSK